MVFGQPSINKEKKFASETKEATGKQCIRFASDYFLNKLYIRTWLYMFTFLIQLTLSNVQLNPVKIKWLGPLKDLALTESSS